MNKVICEDVDNILALPLPWEKLYGKTVLIAGATSMLASYMAFVVAELGRRNPENGLRLILGVRNIQKAHDLFGTLLNEPQVEVWNVDFTTLFSFDRHVDYIVHAASITRNDLYLVNPVQVTLPNSLGTWQLLELARREKADGFLYFSSGAVYGKIEDKTVINEEDNGKLQPMDIRSCYGESKRFGENLCAAYAAQYKVPANSVRISHTYGPTLDLNDSRVFCEFVKNAVCGEDIVMKSEGLARRPFCYITDAVEAFFRILFSGVYGEAFNMCNNDGYCSIHELACLLAGLYPEKNMRVVRVEREPSSVYYEDSNAFEQRIDCSKLQALGWSPRVPLKDGFRRTVESFLHE